MSDEPGNRLKSAARSGDKDALEEIWLESLEDPGPAEAFMQALDALDTASAREISLNLLPLLLEVYDGQNRHPDALLVSRRMAYLSPDDSATRRALLKHLTGTHKGEPWFDAFINTSGLLDRIALDKGLDRFDSFYPYKPGAGVEHGSGWGIGIIQGYNDETWDAKVKFDDGFQRELPLTSAVDNLKPLADDDFRVMLITRPDDVKALAQDDPAKVIRAVLAFQHGKKLNAAKIKEALVEKAVPAKAWARWWTAAKKAAAGDPYLQVEGGSRPVFKLRDRPVSLEEEAKATVEAADTLTEVVKRTRDYLASRPDKPVQTMLLEVVNRRVQTGREYDEDHGALLDGVLLLEQYDFPTELDSITLLQESIDPESEGSAGQCAEIYSEIAMEKSRSLALSSIQAAFPEEWPSLISGAYEELPKDLLDSAADSLVKQGHGSLLADAYRRVLLAPWRFPWPVFFLGRRRASAGFDGVDNAPSLSEAALGLLKCLESSLFHTQNTKLFRREIAKRFEELLFDPKRKLLARFVADGQRDDLVRAISMVNITSQVPEAIQDYLRSEISFRYPELVEMHEKPFWEEDCIFCTHEGIVKRNRELMLITEEKLPEIFKAIGKAADFGDLSENAEWTAALEEQRLLTEKAGQIEKELGEARPIEDQRRPPGMVSPGTRVVIERLEGGGQETLAILGPWDTGDPGVISYKAPYAASLLGAKEGEEVEVQLPGSSFLVKVISVEIL